MNRKNAYGTPVNASLISHTSDLNFDIDTEDTRPRRGTAEGVGVRFGLKDDEDRDKKVVRIWHADDIYSEEKDFQRITSFKSAVIHNLTTAKDVRDFVSTRLKIKPEMVNHFKIYVIHQQTKKAVRDDERLKPFIENTEGEVKFALLSDKQIDEGAVKPVGPVFEITNDSWEPKVGHLVTHRRLLNYDKFCSFSNLTFLISNLRVYSFRCIIEARCPQLLSFESIIKKKKEKKSSIGPVLTVSFKDDSFLTYPILMQILDYIYTDSIEYANLSIVEILHILHAAMLIKIPSIIWNAEYYLLTHLGLHNVYLMMKTSNELQIKSVKNFCINFAHAKWSEFASNKAGLEVLGIDLFQDLTVTIQQRKEISVSTMQDDQPPSTFIDDMKKIYETMPFPDATAEFEVVDFPINNNNNHSGPNSNCNINSGVAQTTSVNSRSSSNNSLNCEKVVFHRSFLAAHEEKLNLLFLEKKDHKPFHFPNISSSAFKGLLKFIYYGVVEIDVISACEILENLIERFDLPKFREKLEEVIRKELTIDNVLRILKITYLPLNEGRVHLTTNLRNNCLELICENFSEIDIPSIRKMTPTDIAFDLLDAMHARKRISKRSCRNPKSIEKKKIVLV